MNRESTLGRLLYRTAAAGRASACSRGSGGETGLSPVIRAAAHGDKEAIERVVAHYAPFAHNQARYRLGPLADQIDPADLVQEAWMITIPRLDDLEASDGNLVAVLGRFLSTVILRGATSLLQQAMQRRALDLGESGVGSGLRATITSVSGRAVRNEAVQRVHEMILALPEEDRRLFVLRALEYLTNDEAAQVLGMKPSVAAKRWQRACGRLRALLPRDLYETVTRDHRKERP